MSTLRCASSTLQQDTCDFRPPQPLGTLGSEPVDLVVEVDCRKLRPADGTSGMAELKLHSYT